MNNINIRKANIHDLKSIQKLNSELFKLEHENYDPYLIIEWPLKESGTKYFTDMINKKIIFVAEKSNNIIGYLAGTIDIKISYISKKTAELNNMYVLNNYRNLGIGKMLISEFKKICKEKKVTRIIVTASSENINAINFYRKQGFKDSELTLKNEI